VTQIDPVNCTQFLQIRFSESKMADRHHFEKPLNRHNSAMVQWNAMKFDKKTHLTLLNLATDKNCFKNKLNKMSAVDVLKATQQGIEPVRCGCL